MINIKYSKKEKRAIAFDNNIEIGECKYIEENDMWNIVHTEVNNNYQGQGIAKKLVECIVEKSKLSNKILIAQCSYAKKIIEN